MTNRSETSGFEERFHSTENPRPADVRSQFERDKARVIHSAAFRRLQGKTQVMGVGEGDFHRTRLTHSLECAQVGAGLHDILIRRRDIPAALEPWLEGSRSLVEAACLAHDIGHPPFGHGGEQALFVEMRERGGFEGNAQTLRVLMRLEKYLQSGYGINPTRRLVLAVLKYPVAYSTCSREGAKPPKCYYDEESDIVEWALTPFARVEQEGFAKVDKDGKAIHRTFDSSLMELADDIAYGVHDLEDIVARGLATYQEWERRLKDAFAAIGGALETPEGTIDQELFQMSVFGDSWQRKRFIGRLVSLFMGAVTVTEVSEFSHPLLRYRAGLKGPEKRFLGQLKDLSFRLVIDRPRVQQLEVRGKMVVTRLMEALEQAPSKLIPSWKDSEGVGDEARRVCDYVAGMTDPYAEKIYHRLFVPGSGSSSDEL